MRRQTRVVALIGAGLLVSCQPDQPHQANNTVAEAVPQRPVLPVAEPPLDREALLVAVLKAASAAALSEDDRAVQRGLEGDRFELRIRFGCGGAEQQQRGDRPYSVRYNADDRTLRLRITPDFTADQPLVSTIAGGGLEAVEGFWIGRPWILKAACPSSSRSSATAQTAAEPASEAPEQPAAQPQPMTNRLVAIAQFFTAADPRIARRDERAYEATKLLDVEEQPSREGYNLVLSGRLKALANGRVISCAPEGTDSPPPCVISAEFDRVWIERADRGDVLAEWGRN